MARVLNSLQKRNNDTKKHNYRSLHSQQTHNQKIFVEGLYHRPKKTYFLILSRFYLTVCFKFVSSLLFRFKFIISSVKFLAIFQAVIRARMPSESITFVLPTSSHQTPTQEAVLECIHAIYAVGHTLISPDLCKN